MELLSILVSAGYSSFNGCFVFVSSLLILKINLIGPLSNPNPIPILNFVCGMQHRTIIVKFIRQIIVMETKSRDLFLESVLISLGNIDETLLKLVEGQSEDP